MILFREYSIQFKVKVVMMSSRRPPEKPSRLKLEKTDNFRNINIKEIAMKKSKFTEQQIVFALRQAENGVRGC